MLLADLILWWEGVGVNCVCVVAMQFGLHARPDEFEVLRFA